YETDTCLEFRRVLFRSVQLLDDVPGARALDLEAPVVARHRLPVRARGRAVVVVVFDVVVAGLGVEVQPIRAGGPPHVDVVPLGRAGGRRGGTDGEGSAE